MTFGDDKVDKFIRMYLSGTPSLENPNLTGWKKFKNSITSLNGILNLKEVAVDYLRNALEEITRDNIHHVQVRTSLLPLCNKKYDKTGLECHKTTREETALMLVQVTLEIKVKIEISVAILFPVIAQMTCLFPEN